MKFAITATLLSLALANLGLAAPAATVDERSPNPAADDWKTKVGWDGKVTPLEHIGTIVDPGKPSPKSLTKRTLGGVYFCPAYDWQGQAGLGCSYAIWGNNQCINTNPSTYRYTLSAIGPDSGTWCRLYTGENCGTGASVAFTNPGMGRLDGYWSPWNDNTYSIRCWY